MIDSASNLLGEISRPELLKHHSYINGCFEAQSENIGKTAETISVTDPATGRSIGEVHLANENDVERTIATASAALGSWRSMLGKDRGALLRCWGALMIDNREDLARIMTAEQGKPLEEARGEINYAADFLTWFAAEAERIQGDIHTPHKPDRRMLVLRQAIGVTAAITPLGWLALTHHLLPVRQYLLAV
ncbi:MAG: aldehyde dehydrogenase family protein [Pseudomonadota bacterium]